MKINARILIAGLVVATLASLAGNASAQLPDRAKQAAASAKIVDFARSKIGQKVGNGECTTLADEALVAANAKPMTHVTQKVYQNKQFVPLASYSWGTRVVQLGKNRKPLMPYAGCIVQFENCKFSKDGYSWDFPHHTAIVESSNGTMITLLHQNVDGDVNHSQVRRQTVDFSGKTSGSLYIYLPNPN